MFGKLQSFIGQSFQRKLLLFTLTLIIATTVLLFIFLMINFRSMTSFSLDQNSAGMQQTVEDYLAKYAQEKATSTWLQLNEAQDNLSVLGRTAQKIVDHYDEIRANPEILNLSIFQTPLSEQRGALSSAATDRFETLIPPALADSIEARELLSTTALLNLTMDAVFDANANNAFVYFIGNQAAPVTPRLPQHSSCRHFAGQREPALLEGLVPPERGQLAALVHRRQPERAQSQPDHRRGSLPGRRRPGADGDHVLPPVGQAGE